MKKETEQKVDIDYADRVVPEEGKKGFVTMFMIMLGFTFFSASMWAGQQLAAGLDFWGFVKSLMFGGAILGLYTGLLGYVGAKTGMSMDLLAQKSIRRERLLSFLCHDQFYTDRLVRRGYRHVCHSGIQESFFGDSKAAMWALVIVAGVCMTASAYFGIDSLTVISYIAVPLVAVLRYSCYGHGGPVRATERSLISSPYPAVRLTVVGGAGLVVGSFVSGGTATPNFTRFAKGCEDRNDRNGRGILYRKLPDVLLRSNRLYFRRRK